MSAIVTALQSPLITRLRLTYDGLPKDAERKIERMGNILDPRDNDAAYTVILKDSNSPPCIPWLGKHTGNLTHGAPLILIISKPLT
jgi:hypothetical protein